MILLVVKDNPAPNPGMYRNPANNEIFYISGAGFLPSNSTVMKPSQDPGVHP